jgi:hypothetical protein
MKKDFYDGLKTGFEWGIIFVALFIIVFTNL